MFCARGVKVEVSNTGLNIYLQSPEHSSNRKLNAAGSLPIALVFLFCSRLSSSLIQVNQRLSGEKSREGGEWTAPVQSCNLGTLLERIGSSQLVPVWRAHEMSRVEEGLFRPGVGFDRLTTMLI